MFLAGGGTKPGTVHGETDELGFSIVENSAHVHELQAAILQLLGFDHERFTFRHQGWAAPGVHWYSADPRWPIQLVPIPRLRILTVVGWGRA